MRNSELINGLQDAVLEQSIRALPTSIREAALRMQDATLANLLRRGREIAQTRPGGETVALSEEQIALVELSYRILSKVTEDHHDDCPCELCQARVGTHTSPDAPEFYSVPSVVLKGEKGDRMLAKGTPTMGREKGADEG